MELHDVSYGIEYFSIYNVWKSVQYGVSNGLDTAYRGFLRVGTTFDIFQNIILIPYLEYGVLSLLDTAYCSLIFYGLWIMPNTRSGATMTREAVNELIARRDDENGDDYEGGNEGGNRNGGVNGNGGNENGGGNGNGNNNGNGNGNEGGNGYNFGGFMPVAQECTYQDFLKCQPLNFNGMKGVIGLTRWFEKIETVIEAAYAIKLTELMRLMIEVYCPRNKIQKMETEMVPDEENKVERFIGGLPDNIQGNMIAGYARNDENKRRFDNNPRDNRGQQPAFKQKNVRGQNMVRAYTAGSNERKGYVGSLPYCNKCRLHHEGLCNVRCGNYKRVGNMTRVCTSTVAPNTQRASVGKEPDVVCYECGRPRHYRKDCP
ncbi:putative reverse transcriptase domain-containing protein [Tanacetum coccineum]